VTRDDFEAAVFARYCANVRTADANQSWQTLFQRDADGDYVVPEVSAMWFGFTIATGNKS